MAGIARHSEVTIVVPIYKDAPTDNDIASLTQLVKVLGKRPIVFVTFPDLDARAYQHIIPAARFEFFDRIYFSSVEGYSRLLLLRDFYRRFADSQFVLIYQTDAWVFADELDLWCRSGFDYVGAPWFDSHDPAVPSPKMQVGNGGFSLRRIDKILRWYVIAQRVSYLKNQKRMNGTTSILLRVPSILKTLLSREGEFDIASQLFPDCEPLFEDLFWCGNTWEEFKDAVRDLGLIYLIFFPWLYWRLRKPSPLVASRFAFEVHPSRLYHINHHRLPFGCHAWEKWEPEFWRKHIP